MRPGLAPAGAPCAGCARPSRSRQNAAEKITNTDMISSRPSSMVTVSTHFAASGRPAKLPTGPISGPRPGPMLASAVAAPVIAVIGDSPTSTSKQRADRQRQVEQHEEGDHRIHHVGLDRPALVARL